MSLEKITSFLQSLNGIEEEWNKVESVIPDGLLCYAIDTGVIKKGNGKDKFKMLPTFLNVNDIDTVASNNTRLPILRKEDAGKFLVVGPDGKKLTLSSTTIDKLVTATELAASIDNIRKTIAKEVKISSSNSKLGTAAFKNVGFNPGDIPVLDDTGKLPSTVVPNPVAPFRNNCSNAVINWLLIDKMIRDRKSLMYYRNSVAIAPEFLKDDYLKSVIEAKDLPLVRDYQERFNTTANYLILPTTTFIPMDLYFNMLPVIYIYVNARDSRDKTFTDFIRIAYRFDNLSFTKFEDVDKHCKYLKLTDTPVNMVKNGTEIEGDTYLFRCVLPEVNTTTYMHPSFIFDLRKDVQVDGIIISLFNKPKGFDMENLI